MRGVKIFRSRGTRKAQQTRVAFPAAGTYTLWLRAYGVKNGNSLHAGLGSQATAKNLTTAVGSWGWVKATLSVPSAGEHQVKAWMREDGYLFIVDRRKDMIISGGFNIYSMEVEAVLAEHPAVRDVCVVGVPDEKWGEAVAAIVVRRADVAAEELVGFCAERLDRYKKPRTVEFVDSLPVNRNGKVDRKAVRAPYWAGAERKVG